MKILSVNRFGAVLIVWLIIIGTNARFSFSETSICTKVKMEIDQELTLERQAFRANMGINNGMPNTTIENISIAVSIENSNKEDVQLSWVSGDNPNALFSIRRESAENISFVNELGTIQPETSADIYWLIIPSVSAANGNINGETYYVGATLTYTINEEQTITEVQPDMILVKPLPELTLDYFLPEDVLADDAFTPEIEPSMPFSFGLMVSNNGAAIASNVKIESATPKIIENAQQTVASFVIDGSEVNGLTSSGSMLVNFGNISPGQTSTARWFMHTAVSGKFTSFNASYTHSDELGGSLTSLIDSADTHTLIHDVLADTNGRDQIRDFLIKDGDSVLLYETDSIVSPVSNQSSLASMTYYSHSGTERSYTLTIPPTDGFLYIRLPNPHPDKILKKVLRSDGKILNDNNFWLSQSRKEDTTWEYSASIFDVNSHYTYTMIFDDPVEGPLPPVIQCIPDRQRYEGENLSFLILASDPNGTVPAISIKSIPVGATFKDEKDGTAVFDWTPLIGQAGIYMISVTATDGKLSSSKQAKITVVPFIDSDNDGLPDDWEMMYFGSLDRNGLGDYDNDGVSDIDEYYRRTDPALFANAPVMPVIVSPADGSTVTILNPQLEIQNSSDPDGDTVSYDFEIYSDDTMAMLVASTENYAESPTGSTVWQIPDNLSENQWYFWRVRATDSNAYSLWKYGTFLVNTVNSPPPAPRLSAPADNVTVNSLTPVLTMTFDGDPDHDYVDHQISIYNDEYKTTTLATYDTPAHLDEHGAEFQVTFEASLADKTVYYWSALTTDIQGASTESALINFYIDTEANATALPGIRYPQPSWEIQETTVDLVADVEIGLSYVFEIDESMSFNTPSLIVSDILTATSPTLSFELTQLNDNTAYYWRVKAISGSVHSVWATSAFFVNSSNDDPERPVLKNPGIDSWPGSLSPVLSVHPSTDPDHDAIEYIFELYSDETMATKIAETIGPETEWVVPVELVDNTRYYWRAAAKDSHGIQSDWMDPSSFYLRYQGQDVTINTVGYNQASFPLEDIKVALFTQSGAYLGQYRITDSDGNIVFNLPDGEYKLRADYCNYYFWSEAFTPSDIPSFVIQHGNVAVHVVDAGTPVVQAGVAILTETDVPLSNTSETDSNGDALIQLPARNYKVKITQTNKTVTSGIIPIQPGQTSDVTIDLSL